jgi:NAD(P)-dependent dehydrogenase (short-subunit alcohol dehydrogenase family)
MDIDIPNLSGKTAVVTGASGGIGAAVCAALASNGAHVTLAVRNLAKGRQVAAAIGGDTEVKQLDLADLASVRTFCSQWEDPIDLLINNAGVASETLQRTKDGFELQFGTNHLGHFALTNLLLPHVQGRVVTVSSQAERAGRLDFDDLNWEHTPYKSSRAYNNSKLANLLFSSELQRRCADSGSAVLAMAAHPGFVDTNIYAGSTNPILKWFVRLLAQDVQEGSLPVLYAATADLPGDSFTGPKHMMHMRGGAELIGRSAAARDRELARQLWEASEQLTGVAAPG